MYEKLKLHKNVGKGFLIYAWHLIYLVFFMSDLLLLFISHTLHSPAKASSDEMSTVHDFELDCNLYESSLQMCLIKVGDTYRLKNQKFLLKDMYLN